MRRSLFVVGALVCPAVLVCPAAFGQSVTTYTSAFAGQLFGYGNRDSHGDAGYVPVSSSHAASASFSADNPSLIDGLVVDFSQTSSASATASASLGQLHVLAEAHSQITPSHFLYYDDGGNAVDLASPAVAVAYSSASAGLTDTITVTSATLPAGTPVDLRVTTTLHVNISSPPYGNASAAADVLFSKPGYTYTDDNGSSYFGLVSWQYNGTDLSGHNDLSSDVLHTYVGDTFTVELDAQAQATGDADAARPAGYAVADAGNTAYFNLDPLTPGADYTAASGLSYDTPVPEPTSLVLTAGLSLLALRRRRRGKV
jgi:hypothetical protein